MEGKLKGILNGIDPETQQILIRNITDLIDRSKFSNLEVEKISLSVLASATAYSTSHTTALRHKRIVGIAMNITDENALEGSMISILIDSNEVFPSGTEAKLLFASTAVPPNAKFYSYVDRDINQSTIKVSFTDGGNFTAAYEANFYLLCVTSETP